MKLSILTPTYNRAELLKQLYNSLKINHDTSNVELEWFIMDDGSTDNTKEVIEGFQKNSNFDIYYFYQKNQGKMKALNNLVQKATGEYLIECDSDDYFTENAFVTIEKQIKKVKNEQNIYGYIFLKQDQNQENMGNTFLKNGFQSNMFDLYFKQGIEGEKVIVFKTEIRKKYQYCLEDKERFITESSLYHKMDLQNQVICFNDFIMICEYKKDGYSENINRIFLENPKGYYKYFKEMFEHDALKGVIVKKKIYIYKHYILFSILAKKNKILQPVKGIGNKIMIMILYLPGKILTKKRFGKRRENRNGENKKMDRKS